MKISNYQALSELLKTYTPETYGFVTREEQELITSTLQIEDMDLLELQNLRDFTVLFLSRSYDDVAKERQNMDKMSAIVHVIDEKKLELGGSV